jgi:hypothetical protein
MSKIQRIAVVLLVGISVVFFSQLSYAYEGPFGPIHVASNRSAYDGRGCPVEIVFTATINFVTPHGDLVFNYHWERSDGAKTATQVVHVPRDERSIVLHEKWLVGAPGHHYDASNTLFVNSGNTHLSESSKTVSVVCR